jgi:2-methylisocitrate lyase-like PEP mutase family enzyme
MTKKKSRVLRELIEDKKILLRPGVAVALHAKLAEAAGFKAVGVSGANTAAYLFGLPDAGLLTMTEMCENAQRVANAVDIPVMVDCDTGYGNAINVRRTVESMIRAGTAGLFIEDQYAPKRCGSFKGKQLISVEEAVGKYRAALDVRNELDPDYVIMARTDARNAVGGSLEEAIGRAKAYKKAGVDVIYIEAIQSMEEMRIARAEIEGPMACHCRSITPQPTLKQLQELGMSMTVGIQFFKSGVLAYWDFLMKMKEHGLDPWVEFSEEMKDHPVGGFNITDLLGFPKIREWEDKYLPPEELSKYEQSFGLYDPKTQKK